MSPGSCRACVRRSRFWSHPRQAAHPTTCGLSYPDVAADGDRAAFLENQISGDETFLRFASVPSFEVIESLRLAGSEPTVVLHANNIFLKDLCRAFCSDRTGAKRWERAFVGEWRMLGDELVLSEYDKRQKHARLVTLDIASGRERVIVFEPASLPSRATR